MNKPVLVVMAAGMGSRYGGMKQIDPVGPCGQVIVDYSCTTPAAQALRRSSLSSSTRSRTPSKPPSASGSLRRWT